MNNELEQYIKESELTLEDIKNAFEKVRMYELAINKAQHEINDGKADQLIYANDIDEVKSIASDAKMEIFKLWYLAHTGKDYE